MTIYVTDYNNLKLSDKVALAPNGVTNVVSGSIDGMGFTANVEIEGGGGWDGSEPCVYSTYKVGHNDMQFLDSEQEEEVQGELYNAVMYC